MDMDIEHTTKIISDHLHLNGINIKGKEYSVEITNYGGSMGIFFYSSNVNEDYCIIIGEGVALRRRIARPDHDHDDFEYLQTPDNLKWFKDRVDIVEFGHRVSRE